MKLLYTSFTFVLATILFVFLSGRSNVAIAQNCPEIQLSISGNELPCGCSFDFGHVARGSTSDLVLRIRNVSPSGHGNLNISNASFTGGPFAIVGPPAFPLVLAPGDQINLTLRFSPDNSCYDCVGDLAILSDDADEGNCSFSLRGTAVEPRQLNSTLLINEFSNGDGGNREYIEMVVAGAPGQCRDLRGWIIDDNSGRGSTCGPGSGINNGHIRFTTDAQWANVPVGSVILIYNAADKNTNITVADDWNDTNNDRRYIIPISNNANSQALFEVDNGLPSTASCNDYTGNYNNLANNSWNRIILQNGGDLVQVIDPTNTAVAHHSIAYGNVAGNANADVDIAGTATAFVHRFNDVSGVQNPFISAAWERVAVATAGNETPSSANGANNQIWLDEFNLRINACLTTTCVGMPVYLTTNAIRDGAGGYEHRWDFTSDATTDATTNLADNLASTLAIYANSGNPSVSLTVTNNGGCQTTIAQALTINAQPVLAASNQTICAGQTTNLNPTAGFAQYRWFPTTNVSDACIQNPNLNPTTNTTYTVHATDALGCTNSTSATVTVNPLPVVAILPAGPLTLCQNETQVLSASGATSYSWSPATDLNNPALQAPTLTASTVGTRTYTVTGSSASGCTSSATITVTVNATPTVAITNVGPLNLCLNSATTLTATGGNTYSWAPATDLSSTSVFNPVLTAATVGTRNYVVIGTAVNGCTNSASITVTVNPAPTITINPAGPFNLCRGATQVLAASGANSYVWTPSLDLSSDVVSSPTLTANTLGVTTYTVTGTDGNGCTNTSSVAVTVLALPVVVISPSGPLTLCPGAIRVLTASGASTYTWNPSGDLSASNIAAPTLTAATTGTTLYTVTGTDVNSCTNTAQISVTVNPLPSVSANTNSPVVCFDGSTVLLDASGANSYVWTPAANLDNSAIASPTFTPAAPGVTTFTVTGTGAIGCTNTATLVITVNALPVLNPSATPAAICFDGSSSQLDATGATSYSWTPAANLSNAALSNPVFTPSSSGNFTFTVHGTDANGCTNTATTTVTVNAVPTVGASASPTTLCFGSGTSALNGTGAASYVWTPAADLDNAAIANPVFTPPASGSVTFTVTGTGANGCTNSAQVTVTVNALPTIAISPAGPVTLCENGIQTLTASGANSYNWSPAGDLSATNIAAPILTATSLGTTVYTVTGTTGVGCTNSASVSVTVNNCTFCFDCTLDEYFQDFDDWDPTTPTTNTCAVGDNVGWNNNNTIPTWYTNLVSGTYRFNSSRGNCNQGSLFAFGTVGSGERALGTLRSGSNNSRIGAKFSNCTGNTITEITIEYTGEQWRRGNNVGAPDRLDFQYSTNATSLATGVWTNENALDFNSPVLVPNNAFINPPATQNLAATIVVSIPPGGDFWVRWLDFDLPGTDDGLAIDDFRIRINTLQQPNNITVSAPPLCANSPVTLTANPAIPAGLDYRWFTVPTAGTAVGTGNPLVVTPPTGGSYTYYVETFDPATGCTSNLPRTMVTFNVNALPVVNASANPTPICFDGSASQLQATGAFSYVWTPGANLDIAIIFNPRFTPPSAGSFTFTVTGTDATGCTNTATTTVVVNAIPVLNPSATPAAICFDGSTSQLNVTGATSFTWTPAANLNNAAIANPVFTPASAGNFTFTVRGTDVNGCTNTATTSVLVNALPLVNAAAAPAAICFDGSNSQLTGTGATSYAWTPVANLDDPSISDPIFSPPSTGNYTFTVRGTDANGCTNTATTSVTVNALPAVAATATQLTLCLDGTRTRLQGSGATSYIWAAAANLTNNTIANPFFDPVVAGPRTFTVTGTDGNGCTNSATVLITVNPLPVVAASATPAVICFDGSTSQLEGTGAVTYLWTPATDLDDNSIATPQFSPSSVGSFTYTVRGTDANGCTNTASTTVTVNALPVVTANAAPAAICFDGSTSQLTATGPGAFVWTPAANLSNAAIINPVFTPTAAGNFTFTVRSTDANGCTNTATTSVAVSARPVVLVNALPTAICFDGSTSQLTAAGATSYTWTPAAVLDDPAIFNPVFTPAASGNATFTVMGTDANGCTNTATTSVLVNALPVVLASATPNVVCFDGTTSQLEGMGAVSFTWLPAADLDDAAIFNPVYTPSASGVFTFTVTGTDAIGCTNSATALVTVNALPVVAASATPAAICFDGSTSQLEGTGADIYSWTPIVDLDDAAVSDPVFTPPSAGNFTFTVMGTDANGCTNTATTSVTVSAVPVVTATATPAAVCFDGSTSQLNGGGATSYVWTPVTDLDDATIINPVFTPTALGAFNYTVMGTDGNGCTNTATATVTVNPLPVVNATATPPAVCFDGSTSQLEGTGANTYVWTPLTDLDDAAIFNPVFTPAAPGNFTYTVLGTDVNGCTGTAEVSILVNDPPVVTANSIAFTICIDGATILLAGGADTYAWTPAANLDDPTIISPVFTPVATGNFTFTVTGTDVNGCTNSASTSVTVLALPVITATAGLDPVCLGGGSMLTANGGVGYLWAANPELSSLIIANPIATPAAVGLSTYTVTGTDANGCTNTATVDLNTNECTFAFDCVNDEYTQDFDNWDPTTPTAPTCAAGNNVGWNSANTIPTWYAELVSGTYRFNASRGNCNTGSLFAYGVDGSGERSLGMFRSGSNVSRIGAQFTNNTGVPITELLIDYVGEQWRRGSNVGTPDRLDFQYSTDATSLSSGTWLDFNALDFSSPALVPQNAAINPPATLNVSGTITGLNILPGQTVWIRWEDLDIAGTDDGLAIDNFRMRVNTIPQPTAISTSTPLCADSDVILTATPVPAPPVDYRWFDQATGGVLVGTGQVLTLTTPAPGTYTYYAEAFNTATGCKSNLPRRPVTFTQNPLPTLIAAATNPICIYQTSQLSVSGASTYVWAPPTGLSNPLIDNPTFTPPNPGPFQFTVTATDANNCVNTATVDIQVNDVPNVTASAVNPICIYQNSQLTGGGAVAYDWTPALGLTNTTLQNPVFTPIASGTFTFTLLGTDANGCTNSASTSVRVVPRPTVLATSTPQVICLDATSQLEATGAATYQWTPGTALSDPTIGLPIFTPTAAGTFTYTVRGTDADGCTNTNITSIIVNPLPVANASANPASICFGRTSQLTATGGILYSWAPGAFLSANNVANPVFTGNVAGNFTYTVTATDANNCQNKAQTTITVFPDVIVNIPPLTLCQTESRAITASGAVAYSWFPGTYLNDALIANPTFNAVDAGVFTYTVTGTDVNGCTGSAIATVTVNAQPTVTATGQTPICIHNTSQLTAGGAVNFSWTPTGGLSDPLIAQPIFTPAIPGTLTFSVTGTDGRGCTNSATTTVVVEDRPVVTAVATPPTICMTETTTLQAGGAGAYQWTPATGLNNVNVSNPVFTPTVAGNFTFNVRGTTQNGCTNTVAVSVTVNPQPTVTATAAPTTICRGESTTLTANGANTYVWQPGNVAAPLFTNAPTTNVTFTVRGTDGNGCTNSATVFVVVNQKPTVTATATPATICTGSPTTLQSSGAVTYVWNPGNLNGAAATANPPFSTTFTVVGTDGNGCTNSASASVIVNPLPVAPSIPSVTICRGNSTTLLPAIQVGTNRWYDAPTGGNLLSVSPSFTTPVLTTAGTSSFYLEVLDVNGCVSSSRSKVDVLVVDPTVPPPAITGDTDVCVFDFDTYNFIGIPGVTYNWTGIPTGANINSGQGTSTIEINWGSARGGTYIITVTPTYPCGIGASRSISITIKEKPLRPLSILGPLEICIGGSGTYNASTRLGETYTWTVSPVGPTLSVSPAPAGGSQISVIWNATGIYSLTVKAANNCGSSPDQAIAVRVRTPLPANAGPDVTTCGTLVQLQAANAAPATGTWRFLSGPMQPNILGSGSRVFVANLMTAGVYEFEWVVENGACPPSSDIATITKIVKPAVPIINNNEIRVCNDLTAQFFFNTPTDGNGTWTFIGGPVIASINSMGMVSGLSAQGIYRFRYTVNNACGSVFADAKVIRETALTAAQVPFAGAPQIVCENPFALLVGSLPPQGYTPSWKFIGGPHIADVANFGRYGSVVNMAEPGVYTFLYTFTSSQGICPEQTSITQVTRVRAPSLANVTGPTQICGTTVIVRGNIPVHGTPNWFFISGPKVPVLDPQNETLTITGMDEPGTYVVRWSIVSPPCIPSSYDHTIVVSPGTNPGIATGDQTFCAGENGGNVQLIDYKGDIVRWEIADNSSFGNPQIPANISPIQGYSNLTTTKYFRALVKQGNCPAQYSNTVVVTILPSNPIVNLGSDQSLCGTTTSIPVVANPTSLNVIWTVQSEPVAGSTVITSGNPATITGLRTGITVISASATTPCGIASDAVILTVTETAIGGSIQFPATVCSGQNSGTLTLVGSTGQILRWEYSTDNWANTTAIVNNTPQQGYSNLTQTRKYRAVAGGTNCPQVNSAEVEIVVVQGVFAQAGPDISVCGNNFLLNGNTVANATLTWTQVSGPANITGPVSGSVLSLSNIATPGLYTFEYRVSNGVCTDAVDLVNVNVGENANIGTVSGNATVCGSTAIGTITLTGFTGQVVRWETSTDNWQTVTTHGNTTPNFTYFNLTKTTQFRAVVATPGCPVGVTNHATVIVNQPPSVAQAPARIDICADNIFLQGNPPINGTSMWSFVFGPMNPSINASGASALVSGMTAKGSYLFEYKITNAPCEASVAYTVVSVSDNVTVGTLTADQTVCTGQNSGTLEINQPAGTIIRWESSINNFTDITTIARTSTIFPYTGLTQTTKFRAVVRNGNCPEAFSNAVTITVDQPSVGGAVTSNATVCSGTNAGTLTLNGPTGDVIGWESSIDNINFMPIANVNSVQNYANLVQNTWFRAVVKNGACSESRSTSARISVDQPSVGGTALMDATVCAGNNNGSLTLGGQVGQVVRWEASTDGGTSFQPISNATPIQIYTNLLTTTRYRAVVKNGACAEAFSSIVVITVIPIPNAGTLAVPATVCSGINSGTLTLTGNSAPVTRWERSIDGGNTYIPVVSSATTLAYLNLTQTTHYRAVVQSGSCPEVFSPSVIIKVDAKPIPGAVTSSQTLCISNASGSLSLNGQVGNIDRWEQSVNGGQTWTPITNTTAQFNFVSLNTTTLFRAVVSNGVCTPDTSLPARIQVDPVTVAGNITGALNSCGDPANRTFTLTGQVGEVIRWEISTDNVNFLPIASTSTTLPYTTTTQRTWYRAVVRSGACLIETTPSVNVRIDPVAVGGSLTALPNQVCSGSNTGTLTLMGQVGTVVRWEQSTDGGQTYTTIANTTSGLIFSDLTQATQYRAVVGSGVCPTRFSTAIDVQVSPALQLDTYAATGCNGLGSIQALAPNANGTTTFSLSPQAANANTTGVFLNLPVGTYSVSAIDAQGCSATEQITVPSTQSTPLLTSITNVGVNNAFVQWLPISGVFSYTLRYRVVNSPNWTVLANLTTTFRLLSGLQSNSAYEVEVSYRCPSTGMSAFSTGPERNFQTMQAPMTASTCAQSAASNGSLPVTQPGGVFVDQITPTTARVNWVAITDAQGYIISWGLANTNPNTWPQVIVCHPQDFFIVSGLTPGRNYQIRVRTNCSNCTTASQIADNRSDWSPMIDFMTTVFRNMANQSIDASGSIEVYPNPTDGAFTVRIQLEEATDVRLQLVDATGRRIMTSTHALERGEQQIPVVLQDFASGVYILEIYRNNQRELVKVVLQ